jgi:hypothetical protein
MSSLVVDGIQNYIEESEDENDSGLCFYWAQQKYPYMHFGFHISYVELQSNQNRHWHAREASLYRNMDGTYFDWEKYYNKWVFNGERMVLRNIKSNQTDLFD